VNLDENSNGVDKYYPYSPACFPFGKEVETYVTCSESGLIMSDILVEALKHIDKKLTIHHSSHFYCWMAMGATSNAFSELHLFTRDQVECMHHSTIWYSHMAGWRLIGAEWSLQARNNIK